MLADLLAAEGRGLFVSVDEMHMHAGADLRRLAEVLQHCVRQDRPVVFAGAGLPSALDEIFEAPGLTFFSGGHTKLRLALSIAPPSKRPYGIRLSRGAAPSRPTHWQQLSRPRRATRTLSNWLAITSGPYALWRSGSLWLTFPREFHWPWMRLDPPYSNRSCATYRRTIAASS